MKYLKICLIVSFLFCLDGFGQEEAIINSEIEAVVKELDGFYDCKIGRAVSNKVIDENLKGIKSNIFFGSEDAVNSNSAISYLNTSEGDKINIGFNYAYKNKYFLNTSIYKNTKGAYFFNSDGWQNNIGASFTGNLVHSTSQFYNENECNTLNKKRKAYIKDVIKEDLMLFNKHKNSLEKEINKIKLEKSGLMKLSELSLENYNRIKEIDSLTKKYSKSQTIAKNALDNPKQYIENKIKKFDSINDILQGHFLVWTSITGNIENQNLKLDSLNNMPLDKAIKNIPKLKFGAALNVSSSNNVKKYKRYYAQVFTNITMASFLESIQKDRKPVVQEVDEELFVFDDQENQLGRYQDLKRAYWTATLGGNLTSFCFSENVGLTAIFNHKFALQDLDFVDYKNRYTAQIGLVFRVQSENDVNKASFRILAGAEDLVYNQKTFKDASVKISIGIPFNLFTKQ